MKTVFIFKTVIPSEIPLNINSPKDVLEFIKNITGISDVAKLHFPDSCLTEDGEFANASGTRLFIFVCWEFC